MKTLSILFILTITCAFAQRNPQIRTCNITQGVFTVYNIPGDKIGHCIYEDASIDTISLMQKVYYDQKTIAVDEFLNGQTKCRGTIIEAKNELRSLSICSYADGSNILLSSLQDGVNSRVNAKMFYALDSKF